MLPRRRFHRVVFLLAGLYNIGWGIFSAVDPQWLFRFARMPLSPYPEIFACLAMVVGLYGILYLEVARRPERGCSWRRWASRGRSWGRLASGCSSCAAPGRWRRSSFV